MCPALFFFGSINIILKFVTKETSSLTAGQILMQSGINFRCDVTIARIPSELTFLWDSHDERATLLST